MPRYFFHVRDGVDIPDADGTVLAGPGEARQQGVVAAGEAIRDLGQQAWNGDRWDMHVTDESGATVCAFSFLARFEGRG